MGENSKIEWTDHTFNAWVGCEKVSPACDHCYAEAWAKRTGHPELWAGERRRTSLANWKQPIKWNKEAFQSGIRKRVFANSLADVFDNKAPQAWREDLFELISITPHLDWLLLTKRIGNAPEMLPANWGDGYKNVWIGATVINQTEYDRDYLKLLSVPAAVNFLSIEPMLGPIDLRLTMEPCVDWIIVGGESGRGARPIHPDWVRSLRDQCQAAGIFFHFKQWGEWLPGAQYTADAAKADPNPEQSRFDCMDWNWDADGYETCGGGWTDDLSEAATYRVGKKRAGRMLDGRTWDEVPRVAA